MKDAIKENKVITFGCRLNAYESEAIKNALENSGQENLIVFNSCAVTAAAERDLRSSIRKIRKENPQVKIVVTGCAAQIDPKKYAKMSEVDLVLGNDKKSDAASYVFNGQMGSAVWGQTPEDNAGVQINVEHSHQDKVFFAQKEAENIFIDSAQEAKIKVNDIMSVRDTAPQLVSYFENQTRAFLEIQNGCNHRCTFCVIPFGRGNSRSVAFGDIVDGVKKMVAAGHKEVVLTGVDISGYGEDLPAKINLSQMIKRLLKLVPELPRLRLSSIDVAEIDEGFFDLIANEKRFMPYFHLSVQSGDDLILKRMKRRHTRQQVIDFCAKAKELRPDIAFGCDIIAGFPTENDEAFENSLNLIKEANLIFTHIFPYSKREGTPAAKMPKVAGNIIKERAKKLREAGSEQLNNFLQKQIGKKLKVLIEKDGFARAENFLEVKISDKNLNSGEIIEVEIIDFEKNYLIANV
jgi:threonylcarbamoyladenosine tRNA methylthiotransferase MtaB